MEYCVAPNGGIFLGLLGTSGWQIAYLDNDQEIYSLEDLWGTPGDGPEEISAVCDLATLDGNDIFVCEPTRVQKFTRPGVYLAMVNSPGGDNGGPNFIELNSISINSLGNLVVGDDGADRAYVFSIETSEPTPVIDDNEASVVGNYRSELVLLPTGIFSAGQNSEFYFETGRNLNSVKLEIFDVRGRLVQILDVGAAGVGRHSVQWDSTDRYGKVVASGVYLLRLEGDGQNATGKTVIVR